MDFDPTIALNQIARQLDQVAQTTMREYAEAVRDNISAGPRSGIHHPGLPRISSAPDEYSQEQSGGMRSRVESWQVGEGRKAGIRDTTAQDFTQALGSSTVSARANMQRTARSSEFGKLRVMVSKLSACHSSGHSLRSL